MEHITIKNTGDVILYIPYKTYKPYRNIGKIIPYDRSFNTVRFTSKNHINKYYNSVGFCYHFIKDFGDYFDLVCVNFDYTFLWTSRAEILKYGIIKYNSNKDLELQIHFPLYKFSRTKQEAEQKMKEILSNPKNNGCNVVNADVQLEFDFS